MELKNFDDFLAEAKSTKEANIKINGLKSGDFSAIQVNMLEHGIDLSGLKKDIITKIWFEKETMSIADLKTAFKFGLKDTKHVDIDGTFKLGNKKYSVDGDFRQVTVKEASINEDTQKAKENADMKKNDASHGEKATVVKEGDEKVLHGEEGEDDGKLDESFNLDKNIDKNWGDELEGVDGYALKNVNKNSYAVAYKDKNAVIVKTEKTEIRLDGSMIEQISRLYKRR